MKIAVCIILLAFASYQARDPTIETQRRQRTTPTPLPTVRVMPTPETEKDPVVSVAMTLLVFGAISAVGFVLYFLPSIFAWRKENFAAILMLNILLGWTFIGWVVAFVWALTKDRRST